jgi:hypothetical protein
MSQTSPVSRTPATATSKLTKGETRVAVLDYVAIAKKNDEATQDSIVDNPIYQMVISDDGPKEQRIAKLKEYLTKDLLDSSYTVKQLDEREKALIEFNSFIQVLRKQLGTEQAKQITSKTYADFQRILNDTTTDVAKYEEKLEPLNRLSELFTKYGVDGNIIEKINNAKEQKQKREVALATWRATHDNKIADLEIAITEIEKEISSGTVALQETNSGIFHFLKGNVRLQLEATIKNNEVDLVARRSQLAEAKEEKPVGNEDDNFDITTIGEDEGILELQNIGGDAFKEAIEALRDHTELTMAKMSSNFDEAVTGLTNTRESFVNLDRNCSDANFALSVLSVAVKESEAFARNHAQTLVVDKASQAETGIEELERMEREQRSEQLLSYTDHLTSFLTDVGVAVASLRSGQAVIKNILRMNQLAIQQANTHKITGIANTADAVTITIGSIVEVCNRAASRALADGLTRMRTLAEKGNDKLVGGAYQSLLQQNEQLQSFVDSVSNIKKMTTEITANSVELLRDQFDLVAKMNQESADLSTATTESERVMFQARAGQKVAGEKSKEETPRRNFGLKVKG